MLSCHMYNYTHTHIFYICRATYVQTSHIYIYICVYVILVAQLKKDLQSGKFK